MTLINTRMVAAGWTYIGEKTAAVMGTTAAVKCYASPGTTVAASIYTGCIVFVEYDDANLRLRFRVAEKFDDSLVATPSSNVKWAAPGNIGSGTPAPTANYAISDSFVVLFQTQGASATVGWVNIPLVGSSFYYWMGGNNSNFIYFNNVGGVGHWVIAGELEFLGAVGGGGESAVYLAGRMLSTDNDVSWTFAAASAGANVRCSREPFSTAAVSGGFCYLMGPSAVFIGASSSPTGGGDQSTAHKWFTGWVWYPVYLHGLGGVTISVNRGLLATMSSLVMYDYSGTPASPSNPPGGVLTLNGQTFVVIGGDSSSLTSGPSFTNALAVRSSDYS
jgi:hypothetical protein